jgi:hypothetical protein
MNELDQIYQSYKKGIKPVPEKKPPTRKSISHGVPEPFFDNDNGSDFSKVNACEKCGSMNVSIDMSTNKIHCNECNEKTDKAKKVNFQRQMEIAQEEEFKKMQDAIDRGETFTM